MTFLGSRRQTAYLCLVLLQLLLAGCSRPPAEDAIRAALSDMAQALEARDSGPVMDRLDDSFHARSGNGELSRRDVQRLLLASFYRHQSISVTLSNIQVQTDGSQRARVTFNALTTGGSGNSWLPDTAQLYRIDSQWVLNDDWQLLSAEARRALEP